MRVGWPAPARRLPAGRGDDGVASEGSPAASAPANVPSVTAGRPTILATSGGLRDSARLAWEVGPLTRHAVALAHVTGRAPRVCFLATACGDDERLIATFYDNAWREGWAGSHLALFSMPNLDDPRAHLLAQDVVWVFGGSVAGLLAMWRLHGLDEVMREAWQSGVVPRPSTLLQSLVADGALPAGYATDDGAGLLYRGTEMVEALAERDGAGAYRVERGPDGTVVETPLPVRRIG